MGGSAVALPEELDSVDLFTKSLSGNRRTPIQASFATADARPLGPMLVSTVAQRYIPRNTRGCEKDRSATYDAAASLIGAAGVTTARRSAPLVSQPASACIGCYRL